LSQTISCSRRRGAFWHRGDDLAAGGILGEQIDRRTYAGRALTPLFSPSMAWYCPLYFANAT
jgi:hypothetical protein